MNNKGVFGTKLDNGFKTINYNGNKLFPKKENINLDRGVDNSLLLNRVSGIKEKELFYHLNRIDSKIFFATVEYFKSLNANWCNLPLTTKMISSPGEVYTGKTLNYSTDALPIKLDWFGKEVFLSESSQFYLELYLLVNNLDSVFCIYNSFNSIKGIFSTIGGFNSAELLP